MVYLAGLIQGLALVTFPAASSIFTSPHPQGYGFSSSQYGAMFLPQVVLAILASSLAPAFARRWKLKRVFLLGLGSDLVSMALLAISNLFISSSSLAYGILLLATAALGLGFGATVMACNTYAEEFFPGRADSAVLALNALLGTGTALAPVFVAVFVGLGAWWLLPVVVGVALLVLLLFSARAPLQVAADRGAPGGAQAGAGFLRGLPRRFWLYEWQLVRSLSHAAARRTHPMGLVCADRLLGDGHHRACPCRCPLVTGASALDLSRVARAPRSGFPGGFAGQHRHRRCARFRLCRPGLFSLLSVKHQLWW